jgi:DNA-binding NtrC family response regulator
MKLGNARFLKLIPLGQCMRQNKVSLLLVDDDIEYSGYMVQLFGKYNFRVSTAADLGTARRKAEELAPDIVMCDKNIGGHRGVVPFLDYMQREKPETPLVLCSAEDGARARVELYCHEFISKVLPFEKIHAGVNHVLSDFGISPPQPNET